MRALPAAVAAVAVAAAVAAVASAATVRATVAPRRTETRPPTSTPSSVAVVAVVAGKKSWVGEILFGFCVDVRFYIPLLSACFLSAVFLLACFLKISIPPLPFLSTLFTTLSFCHSYLTPSIPSLL